ncbi:hypothetical protein BX666DRAFT_1907890 [Dichotomocladium elegans]|nr:hypothetical protein BX666DRAFT_1907890 [Dichotomocladium elegans]
MSTDYQGSPNSSSSQGIMVNPVEAQQIRTANSREAKEEGLDASKFLIEDSLSTTKKIESWHDSNHESTPESDSNLPSESNLIRAMGLQTSHHSSQNYEVDGSAPQLVGPPQSNRESVIAESELATASQQDESDNHVRNEVQNGDDPVLIYLKKLSGHSRLENTDQAKDLLQLIKSNSHTDARLGVLELIQRTDSRDILDSVANSQKFCSCCSKWMNSALEDQSWLLLENMLKTLMHLPMQLKKVRKYNLGIAVRRTKDKAKVNDKVEVQQLADKLIETWKDMQAEASQDASAGTSAVSS